MKNIMTLLQQRFFEFSVCGGMMVDRVRLVEGEVL